MNFRDLALQVSNAAGTPVAFCAAVACIATWAISGPFFGYSEGWQLTVNTGTTIVTFLMVFLIQAAQNRDTRLLQLKLDELIRVVQGARTELIRADEMTDDVIEQEEKQMKDQAFAEQRAVLRSGLVVTYRVPAGPEPLANAEKVEKK